jgi:hypothetical protein
MIMEGLTKQYTPSKYETTPLNNKRTLELPRTLTDLPVNSGLPPSLSTQLRLKLDFKKASQKKFNFISNNTN